MGTTMQRFTSLLALLAIVVMAYAVTEVQELGNDDSSSALEGDHAEDAEYDTQMEHADDDDEDELGEENGRRAGGAFLSTTGSFTLSSGGGGLRPEEEDEE